jgi:gamma-glutamylcyclotransferase (GGCT)/AIG2-like uncharacterized protein YtfP
MVVRVAGCSLFVYGTLTVEDRVVALTGRRFPRRPARLSGYRRITATHGYPDLVPSADGEVEGFLLEGIDDASLRALDAYEDAGRLYHRRPVRVRVGEASVDCEAYLGQPDG